MKRQLSLFSKKVAKLIFGQNVCITFTAEKVAQIFWATYVIFLIHKVNNHPMGEKFAQSGHSVGNIVRLNGQLSELMFTLELLPRKIRHPSLFIFVAKMEKMSFSYANNGQFKLIRFQTWKCLQFAYYSNRTLISVNCQTVVS
jgi:hypothetical protein